MNISIVQNFAGDFILTGKLTLHSVAELWQKSSALFAKAPSPLRIDLKAVTQSDSAGTALLISWVNYAHQLNKEIYFFNLPKQMQAIIQVSGLSKLLPIEQPNKVGESYG